MVENNDLKSENTMNSTNVKLITDKKKILEDTTLIIQEEIKSSFDHLINALRSREKQLLRQVEAIRVQQLSLIQSNLELVSGKPLLNIDLSSIYDLESHILHLGKLEVFGQNGMTVNNTEPYKVQEYQDADKDHESFNKSIKFEERDSSIEFECKSNVNLSIPEDSVQTCGNGTFNCSCNSSFNSSIENENKSGQELSVLSISNCTVIEKELLISQNESFSKVESDEKLDSINPKESSLDLTNENFQIDSSKDAKSSKKLIERYSNNEECEEMINSNICKDINANKEQDLSNLTSKNRQIRRDSVEHPKQIQQWLQQILVETETEPMIHEIEQFSEISKARLSGQFPLET